MRPPGHHHGPPSLPATPALEWFQERWNAVHAIRRGTAAFGQLATWTITSRPPKAAVHTRGMIVLVNEEEEGPGGISAYIRRVWKRERRWTIFLAEGAHSGRIYVQVPNEWVYIPWACRGPMRLLQRLLVDTIPAVPTNRITAARVTQIRSTYLGSAATNPTLPPPQSTRTSSDVPPSEGSCYTIVSDAFESTSRFVDELRE